MRVMEVIPSRVYVHKPTGRTASPYGAAPWVSDAEKPEWELKTRGYTWLCADGTIGLCRQPAKTYEEAVEIMDKVNNLSS